MALDLVYAGTRKGSAGRADGRAHDEVARATIVITAGIVAELMGKENVL